MKKVAIEIELEEIIDAMPPDELRDFTDSLACKDSIIENVTAQLLGGFAELVSQASTSGSASGTWAGNSPTVLERCRRRLLAEFPEQISREILAVAAEAEAQRAADRTEAARLYEIIRELRGELFRLGGSDGVPMEGAGKLNEQRRA